MYYRRSYGSYRPRYSGSKSNRIAYGGYGRSYRSAYRPLTNRYHKPYLRGRIVKRYNRY